MHTDHTDAHRCTPMDQATGRDGKGTVGILCPSGEPGTSTDRQTSQDHAKRRHGLVAANGRAKSWPGLARPSTTLLLAAREDVGGRAKPGHDTGLCGAAGRSSHLPPAPDACRGMPRTGCRNDLFIIPRLPCPLVQGRQRCRILRFPVSKPSCRRASSSAACWCRSRPRCWPGRAPAPTTGPAPNPVAQTVGWRRALCGPLESVTQLCRTTVHDRQLNKNWGRWPTSRRKRCVKLRGTSPSKVWRVARPKPLDRPRRNAIGNRRRSPALCCCWRCKSGCNRAVSSPPGAAPLRPICGTTPRNER